MELRQVERDPEEFQQPVAASQIAAICRRTFGPNAEVLTADELGLGSYNSTYRLTLAGHDRPVVLRVAPAEDRQFGSERHFMRNEYASLPWLTTIAPLLPEVIAADWSHNVIDRDWMIQTLLDGVPAPELLPQYPSPAWSVYFRALGAIARAVHNVTGPHFGYVIGPHFRLWSDAVISSLEDIASDLDTIGLDAADVRRAVAIADGNLEVLDEVTTPCLLSGDLWNANVMLAEGAPEPTIVGVMDFDRTLWGDPAADWPIRIASASSARVEKAAFWHPDGYGSLEASPHVSWRMQVYEARHLAAVRLESHRARNADGVRDTYGAMAAVLAELSDN